MIFIVVICGCLSPADFNRDGAVNGIDLDIMLAEWGGPGRSDIDRDGVVSSADLKVLLEQWT